MDPARRAFLSGSLLTREGRDRLEKSVRDWGPQPPWLGGSVGAWSCRECAGACVSACPPGIIRRHPGDHARAGTPYLSFEEAGCNFCGACVETCPEEVARSASEPLLGRAQVDAARCLTWNGIVCMACFGRCPEGAIAPSGWGRPQIDTRACNGCGCCVAICPAEALCVTWLHQANAAAGKHERREGGP
jgi:ferredoxin-type protein NapF